MKQDIKIMTYTIYLNFFFKEYVHVIVFLYYFSLNHNIIYLSRSHNICPYSSIKSSQFPFQSTRPPCSRSEVWVRQTCDPRTITPHMARPSGIATETEATRLVLECRTLVRWSEHLLTTQAPLFTEASSVEGLSSFSSSESGITGLLHLDQNEKY